MVSEQGTAAGAVATMANWSLPSLMGPLPWNPPTQAALSSPDALLMYANAKNRSVRERGYLQPDWRGALARWVGPLRPLFANRTAQGVFTGDEMGCGASKVNPANYSAILRELRALVGPGALLYANDCIHSAGSSLHPKNDYKPGCCVPYPTPARPSCRCGRVDLKVVPPELDLVSMDCCELSAPDLSRNSSGFPRLPTASNDECRVLCCADAKPSYYNASEEVAYTQAYYRENIFPSLQPHQRVLLVPGE